MSENNFELDGVEYVAVDGVNLCDGCAFYTAGIDVCTLDNAISELPIPYCTSFDRKDGRGVIFKKKVES